MFVATAVGGHWWHVEGWWSGSVAGGGARPVPGQAGCVRALPVGWLMYLQRLRTAQLKSESLRAAAQPRRVNQVRFWMVLISPKTGSTVRPRCL
jgi:hypothetical protein